MSAATTASAVARVFRDAGVTGRLHALDIDTGREFAVGATEPVVLASVFKLPLLVAFFRLVGEGVLDARDPVVTGPDQRCSGATGTSVLLDEVTMSLRDLAAMMITVSDNAAADAVFARVGPDTINAAAAELGLTDTHIAFDSRRLHDSLLEDAGAATMNELWVRLGEPGFPERLRALDPARTNRSTPRDMTRLLSRIWTDTAASAEACAQMRRMLGLQVWPHRLASGFPYDDVLVSGKTGTLPLIRNEVGVVDYPDGGRYAVAVFTRAATPTIVSPPSDAAIGTAARLAVRHLRS